MEAPDKSKYEFWGGLTEQGEAFAIQLRDDLAARGFVLEEGARVPLSEVDSLIEKMGIGANIMRAFAAPSFIKHASGLEAEFHLGGESEPSYYLLKKPEQAEK